MGRKYVDEVKTLITQVIGIARRHPDKFKNGYKLTEHVWYMRDESGESLKYDGIRFARVQNDTFLRNAIRHIPYEHLPILKKNIAALTISLDSR